MDLSKIERTMHDTHQVLDGFVTKSQAKIDELSDKVAELEQKGAQRFDEGPAPSRHKLGRVLKALADPRAQVDGFEAEWSQEFEQKSGLKLPGAVWVPLNTKSVDYSSESPTSGGSNLVATELRSNEFIDILRQQSVIMRLNPRVIRGTGNISVPKASSGATAYWVSGDGASITESEPVYTSVDLEPTFCAARVKYNYRVGLQTGGDVENVIRRDLVAQIAAEIDNQAINGNGASSKITGILNTTGINSTTWGASPAAVAWADVLELEKMLIDDKALIGDNLHYLTDPATYKTMKSTTKTSTDSGAGFLVDFANGRPMLNGYPLHVSTHVPANTLIFGNFSELLVGDWGGVALMSDPYSDFASGTVGVRAMWPVSLAVRHAVSFAKSAA